MDAYEDNLERDWSSASSSIESSFVSEGKESNQCSEIDSWVESQSGRSLRVTACFGPISASSDLD